MTTHARPDGELPTSLEAQLAAQAPALRAYLRRVNASAASGAELDDLVQESLVRALRYSKSYDSSRPLGAWLRTVALRVLLDQRARVRRAPQREGLEDSAAPTDTRVEHRDELGHLLAPLSALERELIVRFHSRGESIRELARSLGLPEGTVKSHLHRARRKLAERGRQGGAR